MAKTKRKVDEEKSAKYDRQKKLAAERQRRFKEKMTEEQREKKRERDRERRRRLREAKVIQPISEMKASDQKKQRKQWKKYSATYRRKQKSINDALHNIDPESDGEEDQPDQISIQQERGRKVVRRDRSKAYRKISKQAEEIRDLQRQLAKYKKRFQREKNKTKNKCSPSPAKQVRELVGRENVSPRIRKRLFVGYALQKQLENQIKKATPKGKERQLMCKVIGSKILKKYRVQRGLKNLVPYKYNKVQEVNESGKIDLKYSRKQYQTLKIKEVQALKKFFEDDSVSRMCPGKKDFVRNGKLKIQRRILLNTMKNLYQKFINETNFKISYSTFTRVRPFWVTSPKAKDRETCACIKHENFEFIISALRNANIIKEKNSHEILKKIVCSEGRERCMLNKCKKCKSKMIQFEMLENDEDVKIFKWESIVEDRLIKGQTKKIKRVIKKEECVPVSTIVQRFKLSLPIFKRHVHNLIHQGHELKNLKENLKQGEVLFHIDFSQNYVCKLASEIQSMHFGASKKQISLHTVVRYHIMEEKVKAESFCTVSDNLDHHCHGVWAHLRPVLQETANKFPDIHTVHVFSDGPSSQYRNKGNVYFMRTLLPTFFKHLKSFSWNYSESGHGKGAMDGVGGSVKRRADDFVKYGNDLTSAADLVKCFNEGNSSITFAEVSNDDIEEFKALLPEKLSVIKGIMEVRQFTFQKGTMFARKLSCFECPSNKKCKHFNLMEVNCEEQLPEAGNSSKQKKILSKKPQPSTLKIVLKVEDVYSSSDDEGVPDVKDDPMKFAPLDDDAKRNIGQDTYVIVSFENVCSKRKQSHNFIGIVQSTVDEDDEVKVMFMKRCSKDKSLFTADENDVPYVSCSQIIAVLPTPEIVLRGKRMFYRFEKDIVLSTAYSF